MEALLTLTMLIVIGVFVFFIFRYFRGRKMISNNDLYKQNGVIIEYNPALIKIRGVTYNVNDVTNIQTIYHAGGAKFAQHVMISVDDLVKPVHKIVVTGTPHHADQFTQRLGVALRKAGAKGFI